MKRLSLLLLAGSLIVGSTSAQNIDDFDTGANPNGWWWNGFVPSMETTGGNPGGWYRDSFINDFIPALRSSTAAGPWAGDYRANGIVGIEFDAQCISGPSATQPMTLVLKDTKGTPIGSDDDYAYFVDFAAAMPQAGAGWSHYSFAIPSNDVAMPAGWAAANGDWFTPGFTAGYDWDTLIQNVDQVEVWMNDPTAFGIWLVWDVGVDNMEIVQGSTAPALAINGLAGGSLATATVSNATPSGNVLMGYSISGVGPTMTPYGLVDMSMPITSLPTMTADAAGVASLSLTVPGGASGLTVYMQSVDLTSGELSNALAEVVL